ncbi:MAG: Crp/Fnr family transcriptional regulator [Haliea sp.]
MIGGAESARFGPAGISPDASQTRHTPRPGTIVSHTTEIKKSLPKLPTIFEGLNDDELRRIGAPCVTVSLDNKCYLFHQHHPAKSAFIVKEGELMIERTSATGKRQIMAFICPGNFIGFTHNDHYEFSVQALTKCTLIEIPLANLLKLADEMVQLKSNLGRISSNVLAHALDQVFALGQKKAHERVCFLLYQLLERDTNTERQIKLTMTRQDIADYLGLTIETVSRAFAKLKNEGLLNIHSAHTIEILDLKTVKDYALSE